MRGRFYSPAWHRFMNSDQGVDPNLINQFGYTIGSPLMMTDPTGYDAGGLRGDDHAGNASAGYGGGGDDHGGNGFYDKFVAPLDNVIAPWVDHPITTFMGAWRNFSDSNITNPALKSFADSAVTGDATGPAVNTANPLDDEAQRLANAFPVKAPSDFYEPGEQQAINKMLSMDKAVANGSIALAAGRVVTDSFMGVESNNQPANVAEYGGLVANAGINKAANEVKDNFMDKVKNFLSDHGLWWH